MNCRFFFAGIALFALPAIFAQDRPEFEVASIKPAPELAELVRSHSMHVGTKIDGAIADFGSMSLGELIQYAFRIKSFQVSGGGDTSARFDIQAKLPYGGRPDEVPAMMQQLLVQRFGLAFHWSSREFPAYALIVGPKGAKLTPRPADFDRAANRALPVNQQAGPLTLDRLAELLTPYFERPVVNRTAIEGEFMVPNGRIGQAWPNRWSDRYALQHGGAQAASLPDTPRVVAILAELGLKLESRKMPFRILEIDKLEKKPTEQ